MKTIQDALDWAEKEHSIEMKEQNATLGVQKQVISLTWKDIKVIVTGADSLLAMKSKKELIEMGEEGYYTAILKEYEQFKKDGLI